MFTAELFRIATIWKQPQRPSRDERIKKTSHTHTHTHTHTEENGSAIETEGNLAICDHGDGPTGYSVQSLSRVRLSVTPWTAARQASLSITNSQSLLKLMSIESMMPPNHLVLCHPLLLLPSIFPSISVLSSESVLCIGYQSIGVSASASVLPKNIQD